MSIPRYSAIVIIMFGDTILEKSRGKKIQNALEGVKETSSGNSLAAQWLGIRASTAGGVGSVPGGGTKIPHNTYCGQTNK